MKRLFAAAALAAACMVMAACGRRGTITVECESAGSDLLRITNPARYLLLPVEEARGEARVTLVTGGRDDVPMDVRLAHGEVDYFVPFELPEDAEEAVVRVEGVEPDAIFWEHVSLSDSFDTENTDIYRPLYHHTPSYGWMNDPNGLVYKDGEYHLYYQYNPYGSMWGNMHWGHSVSRDLVHWEPQPLAIGRDTMGHIFSGCAVVDRNGDAGFGRDALIAFYTSASDRQVQCMAYSTDNGRTFTKYEGNPVLTPFDGLRDFRDPKVFWYEPAQRWYMIVSADRQMRFYSSRDMKQWKYVSAFGDGYGAQPSMFECPDFVELPVDGDENNRKWVMIVNVNPGCMFGGSGTEYFVGEFDGHEFVCDSDPDKVKWLDYGKDHYATVCFSNTGDRVVAVPWMSNWQYANNTPSRQHRGANALPRELSLYTMGGETYVAADVAKEVRKLRRRSSRVSDITVEAGERMLPETVIGKSGGAFEIEMDVTLDDGGRAGLELCNGAGERTSIYLDMFNGRLVMDRSVSGVVDFGGYSDDIAAATNNGFEMAPDHYQNDFALATWGPLALCEGGTYHLDIFVDRCSVEVFVDGGRIAMTNLVFPTQPYDRVRLFAEENTTAHFTGIKAYRLAL